MLEELRSQDDARLVQRCRAGEAAAWRVLVERYQRLVYAVARSAGLDEHAAADVFQTVFSRLVKALPDLAQPDRLRAWIVTTAKRESWSQMRAIRRLTSSSTVAQIHDDAVREIDTVADDTPGAEQVLDRLQQLHLLQLALGRLDTRCHGLLQLLFEDRAQPPSYAEISVRLDMPAGSIGPTRARCLDKLRALLLVAERDGA